MGGDDVMAPPDVEVVAPPRDGFEDINLFCCILFQWVVDGPVDF